jgi:hypothetical protein
MGTFDDSKIKVARKQHKCDGCRGHVLPGDEYLSFKLGQRWSVAVHLHCAMSPHNRYRCRALEERQASPSISNSGVTE